MNSGLIPKKKLKTPFFLFCDAKNIFERNDTKDTERIIKKQRNSIIQQLKSVEATIASGGTARQYDIQRHNLTTELRFLNWVLERYEFDRQITE